MNQKDVLMVLPKRTVRTPSALKRAWALDKDPVGITIYQSSKAVGHANWEDSDDFGVVRPAITVLLPENEDIELFDAMVSRLAIAYEALPEKYPLYIRVPSDRLDIIARASRMGFVPYFGEWKESNADESEKMWVHITDALRAKYPNGLDA